MEFYDDPEVAPGLKLYEELAKDFTAKMAESIDDIIREADSALTPRQTTFEYTPAPPETSTTISATGQIVSSCCNVALTAGRHKDSDVLWEWRCSACHRILHLAVDVEANPVFPKPTPYDPGGWTGFTAPYNPNS